jgi:hypothetical protein
MVIFGFRKIDEIISKTSESSGRRSLIARDSAAFFPIGDTLHD